MSVAELRTELADPYYSEVRHVGITGGEPTLRKDLFELYELLPQCLPKLAGASFITHGMQTNQAVTVYTRVHAHYLSLNLTFDGMVSLDGVGAAHDQVRGRKGAFESATQTLLQLKQNGVRAIAACTIVRTNVYGLHDLLEWGKANGVYIRFRIAEFIRRLYNDSCVSEIRAFSQSELRHLVCFFHVLLTEYETSDVIRKTYSSILSLLTGGDRLIGCPYQKGAAVNVDSRGWLACCAPKGTSIKRGDMFGELESALTQQRREIAKEHCPNCIHDYHDDWSQEKLQDIVQSRSRAQELYGVTEQQLTLRELDVEPLDFASMNTVLLAGWYGTETAGDIAILRGIIDEYLTLNPNLQFRILSLYPYYTRSTVASWPEALQSKVLVLGYESQEAWQATLDCGAVVMAGGPLMDINETRMILCLFKRFTDLGKPRIIEGCGIGPLNNIKFRWNVCRIARLATKISVRDSASREYLRSLGIRKPVEVRRDPAVTFIRATRIRHEDPREKIIRCFLRELTSEYPQAVTSEQATVNLAGLLKKLLDWYPEHRIELWAMHHFPVGKDDRVFAQQLLKSVESPRITCDWEPRTPTEILQAMAGAEFCVCMRFHSCVFASEVGVPFMAIDYTDGGKIKAYLEDTCQVPRLTGLAGLPAMERPQFEAMLRTRSGTLSANKRMGKASAPKTARTLLHIIEKVTGTGETCAMVLLAKSSCRMFGDNHRLVSLLAAEERGLRIAEDAGLPVLNKPGRDDLALAIEEADLILVHWWNNPDLAKLFRYDLPAMRLSLWIHSARNDSPQVPTRHLIEYSDLSVASNAQAYAHPVFSELPEQTRLDRTALVRTGVDSAHFDKIQPHAHKGFRIGYVGAVDPAKIHPDFISMSCAINVVDATFVVCGHGEMLRMSSEVENRERVSSFEFPSPFEDVRTIMETLDVYCYPVSLDYTVGVELHLQEALFAGLPVVAFACSGIQDFIQHGETGLLVQTPEEYIGAIEALAQNPAERARLGSNAAAFSRKHWGAEVSAKEFNSLFERLMAKPKRERRWGIPIGARLAATVPSLPDQIPSLAVNPGARLFIEALEQGAKPFLDSLTATNLEDALEAEDRIGNLPSPMHLSGVLPFRNAFPRDSLLHLWAGLGFQKNGAFGQAYQAFSLAFENGFEHWRIHWYRATAAERSGRLEDAAAALRLVLQIAPNLAPVQDMAGRLSAAGHAIKSGSSSTPSELILFNIGEAQKFLQSGKLHPARECLQRALNILPNNLDLMEAIADIDCNLGNIDSARTLYGVIQSLDAKRSSQALGRIRKALGIIADAGQRV